MSEEQLSFQFYSVLKNEDADPFMEDGLIAVADGLGGAGSHIHELDEKFYKAPTENFKNALIKTALREYNEHTHSYLKPYIDKWFEPMIDKKPDTSALWASRIVIARFVYALREKPEIFDDISDESKRELLSRYITKGLEDIAEALKLETGKYDNQKLLPTTLAAISYIDEQNKVAADVLWAGDSRCYILKDYGLKQITIDDENSAEEITNMFHVGKKAAVINHKPCNIKKPCILLAVSDGIFDPYSPYDNLGVEATLLENLQESKTVNEFCEKLKVHYDKIHGDDSTMAFVPFGFNSFSEIKKTLEPRTKVVLEMWKKYKEMKPLLEMVSSKDASDDIVDKIKSRTLDKYDSIIASLVDAYQNKKEDIILSDYFKEKIASILTRLEKEFENKKEDRKKENLLKIKKYILENYADFGNSMIPYDKMNFIALPKLGNDYKELLASADNLVIAETNLKDTEKNYEEKMEEYNGLNKVLQEKREEFHQKSVAAAKDRNTEKYKEQNHKYNIYSKILENYLIKKPECSSIRDHTPETRELAQQIDDFIKGLSNLEKIISDKKKDIKNKQFQYEKASKNFFGYENEIITNLKLLFKEKYLKEYGFDSENQKFECGPAEVQAIIKELSTPNNTKTVEEIVSALAKNYDKKSVIDSNYNESRLGKFREYYKLQSSSSAEAEKFLAQLNAFEEEYVKLDVK